MLLYDGMTHSDAFDVAEEQCMLDVAVYWNASQVYSIMLDRHETYTLLTVHDHRHRSDSALKGSTRTLLTHNEVTTDSCHIVLSYEVQQTSTRATDIAVPRGGTTTAAETDCAEIHEVMQQAC